jgi:hypothetical protein
MNGHGSKEAVSGLKVAHGVGIIEHSKSLGDVPVIEQRAERGKTGDKRQERLTWNILNWKAADMVRYEISAPLGLASGRVA